MKDRKQGFETAIKLIRQEIRAHYGCKLDPCPETHDFDEYGDALAESLMAIRRIVKGESNPDEIIITSRVDY